MGNNGQRQSPGLETLPYMKYAYSFTMMFARP